MELKAARSLIRAARGQWNDLVLTHRVAEVDAFLVSYPKSGRTWLRYLLSSYIARIAALDFAPDLQTTFRVLPNFDLDKRRGLPAFVGKSGKFPLPLIAVSHRMFEPAFFADKPVVLLLRDPRDVCVSAYFHQTRHKNRFSGSMPEFIGDEQFGLPSIISYHNSWARGLAGRQSLVVSYEDMSQDIMSTASRVLSFLDLPIDESLLAAAIDEARFDSMKRAEQTTRIPAHSYDPTDEESARVRKGKVGGFADYLSADDVGRITSLCREGLSREASKLMAMTGFEF